MALHEMERLTSETSRIGRVDRYRVPGGWIYYRSRKNFETAVFVPATGDVTCGHTDASMKGPCQRDVGHPGKHQYPK